MTAAGVEATPATGSESLIPPHGGALEERLLPEAARAEAARQAATLPRIALSSRQLADLELLAVGAASPLRGFLGRADYERVVRELRLADGAVWSLPLTLAVDEANAAAVREGGEVALV